MKDIPGFVPPFPALADEHEIFTYAVGRFIMQWTDAELMLYRVLVYYAGVSDAVGRAIFSGTRFGPMGDFLRSIIDNTDISTARAEDLELVLPQMTIINTLRDDVVHRTRAGLIHGTTDPAIRIISNEDRVNRYANIKDTRIGSGMIFNVLHDLRWIQMHLDRHLRGKAFGAFISWEKEYGEVQTWRYQPSPPKKRNQRRSGKRQVPQPPLKPYPETQ